MEVTGTVGKMNRYRERCWCTKSGHGKEVTEEQHRKDKKCQNKHETLGKRKLRWNKKRGILEKSSKHSNIRRWIC